MDWSSGSSSDQTASSSSDVVPVATVPISTVFDSAEVVGVASSIGEPESDSSSSLLPPSASVGRSRFSDVPRRRIMHSTNRMRMQQPPTTAATMTAGPSEAVSSSIGDDGPGEDTPGSNIASSERTSDAPTVTALDRSSSGAAASESPMNSSSRSGTSFFLTSSAADSSRKGEISRMTVTSVRPSLSPSPTSTRCTSDRRTRGRSAAQRDACSASVQY
mmetsp:Transcript_15739/g.49268  ORF Transcript_15739/g.49268 Transcript_15739/m.49268 type:complete len:218 (-) Transcript_15739:687-1340(-)